MPGWKFWETVQPEEETPPATAPAGRFNVRPRTDLVGGALPADQAAASRVSALRKRRDEVLFDVEEATLAGETVNPWLTRVATIEEATRAVEADLAGVARPDAAGPGLALPSTAVMVAAITDAPSPLVTIRVGATEIVYVEDLDWSERGHQLARTELHLELGDPSSLVPPSVGEDHRAELVEVLGDSLFRLATEARDASTVKRAMPPSRPLSALAVPDDEFGGWVDVTGSSPRRRAHAVRVAELTAELERLRTERDKELEEMARWRERLPIAQRRLRDVDEQIAASLATGTS